MNNLIKICVPLAILTVSSGQLPRMLKVIKTAQLKLIKESQASKWPKGLILNSR